MSPTNRLITFRPSHYCEKARWALERAQIPYREESHVPVFSWLATYGAGGGRTVPVLVAGGRVLADSTDILRWVDEQGRAPPLFTGDEAAALEDDLDRRLGPATRRLAYFHILPARARVKAFLRQHGRPWEAQATRVLFPVVRAAIVRGLRVDAEGAARSRRVIDETFADVAARLADGRRYLLGDRFSAADLTFGALAYPVLVPGGAIARGLVPPLHELPASVGPLVDELRATAAGRFALRLWEERPG